MKRKFKSIISKLLMVSIVSLVYFGTILVNPIMAKANVLQPGDSGSVVINELMWPGSSLNEYDEWIELRNMTDQNIDFSVTPWYLAKNGTITVTIDEGILEANGYFLISNYPKGSDTILNIDPDLVIPALALTNTNVQYSLCNQKDGSICFIIVDLADNGDGNPLTGNNNAPKTSMERNIIPSDGRYIENWHDSTGSINLITSALERATPGWENDNIAPTAPVINPVLSPVNADNQIITGTAEVGSLVTVTVNTVIQPTVQLLPEISEYSITVPLVQDTTNNISITSTDAVGNISTPATAVIVEDSIFPEYPTTIIALDHPNDNGKVIDVSWTKSLDAVGYKIKATATNDSTAIAITEQSVGDINQSAITVPQNNVKYYFFIAAIDTAGNQSEFTLASIAEAIDNLVLIKPTMDINITADSTGFTLTYNSIINPVTSVVLQISDKSDFSNIIREQIQTPTTGTININGLPTGLTYYFRLKALNGSFMTDYSATQTGFISKPEVQAQATEVATPEEISAPVNSITALQEVFVPIAQAEETIQTPQDSTPDKVDNNAFPQGEIKGGEDKKEPPSSTRSRDILVIIALLAIAGAAYYGYKKLPESDELPQTKDKSETTSSQAKKPKGK